MNDVSFSVRQHEVMGILGHNGAGKSTTMTLISGAIKVTTGADRSGRPRPVPADAASQCVLQRQPHGPAGASCRNCQSWKTRWRAQSPGTRSAGGGDANLPRILTGTGRAEEQERPGGDSLTCIDQNCRELARALAGEPEVLLLAEWLAGLNPSELRIGIDLIASLRAEGRNIMLAEYVMDSIRALCARCVMIYAEQNIAEGMPQNMLSDAGVIKAYPGDAYC